MICAYKTLYRIIRFGFYLVWPRKHVRGLPAEVFSNYIDIYNTHVGIAPVL
jgi:hypothetical protein